MIAKSYSRLRKFKQCPKQVKMVDVDRVAREEQSLAAQRGDRLHKSIENRIAKGHELAIEIAGLEPLIQGFEALASKSRYPLQSERELCFDTNMMPSGWRDKKTVFRAKLDLWLVDHNHTQAVICDWKTGKIRPDDAEAQARVYAAVAFKMFCELTKVNAYFIYLDHNNEILRFPFTKSQQPELWHDLAEAMAEVDKAEAANEWPAQPGFHCKWCAARTLCPEGKNQDG